MDSQSWIIATDSGSYRGTSFGADGVTFVLANAHRYASPELAAACIDELAAGGDTRSYHIEVSPPKRRSRY